MRDILFEYEINPTTWAYLSALLTIGIYFKFHRFWSLRNLDLVGLVAFSPGLLLVFHGLVKQMPGLVLFGYAWMLGVGGLFILRLLLDPVMVRRPLLEPNLNASGLTFTGAALLVFLGTNILVNQPARSEASRPLRLEQILPGRETVLLQSPGYPAFYFLASFYNMPCEPRVRTSARWEYPSTGTQVAIARIVALVAIVLLVLGMVMIGHWHFDSIRTGVAAASLYLLLPYMSQMTGRIDHIVPAAIVVWAVAFYRRPLVAGLLLGAAAGLVFYPLFLVPLWCSFYWRRGLTRYLIGMAFSLLLMIALLPFLSDSFASFRGQLQQMFGGTIFAQDAQFGFWRDCPWAVRIPVLAVYGVVCAAFGLWPAQKNLGTLASCSAAVMLGSQFCQAHEGGLAMAWYLPLLIVTVFRPNLEDRVAVSAVIEGKRAWVARLGARLRKT
ncbi:MAG: hypothetical protein ACUVUC_14220 [Thermoguttaceae bacterium]